MEERTRAIASATRSPAWRAAPGSSSRTSCCSSVWIAINVGAVPARRHLRSLSLQLPHAGRIARGDLPVDLRAHVAEPHRAPGRSPRAPRSAGRPAGREGAHGDAAHAAGAVRQAGRRRSTRSAPTSPICSRRPTSPSSPRTSTTSCRRSTADSLRTSLDADRHASRCNVAAGAALYSLDRVGSRRAGAARKERLMRLTPLLPAVPLACSGLAGTAGLPASVVHAAADERRRVRRETRTSVHAPHAPRARDLPLRHLRRRAVVDRRAAHARAAVDAVDPQRRSASASRSTSTRCRARSWRR